MEHLASQIVTVMSAVLVLAACLAGPPAAADTTWDGTTGNWSIDDNWTANEPDSSDIAYINNGGTAEVTQAGEVCQRLRLGVGANESGTVNMTGGDLTVGCEEVGYEGTGTFTHSSGTHTVSDTSYLMLGYWAGSSGEYTLTGDGVLIAGTLEVGVHGTGTFTQNGAGTSVDVSKTLHVGMGSPGLGTYNLIAGDLTAEAEELNFSCGTATFNQSGGTNTVTGDLRMSRRGGGRAEYHLSGGALNVAGNITGGVGDSRLFLEGGTLDMTTGGSISVRRLFVARQGGAAYTQSGAENVTVTGSMYVGDYITHGTPFSGTYNMNSSGTLSVDRNLFVGARGTGVFDQDDGTVEDLAQLILAYRTGSQGTYTLDGAASALSASREFIGWSGTGVFTQEDGTNTVGRMFIGRTRLGNGTYTLNDGQLQSVSAAPPPNSGSGRPQYVGYMGHGVFNHTGGTNRVDTLRVGFARGSDGTYNLNSTDPDGDELEARWLFIGHHGAGEFQHTAGTCTVHDTLTVQGNGLYDMDGGDLTADVEKIGAAGIGTFDQSGGVNTTRKLYIGNFQAQAGTFTAPFIEGRYLLTGGELHVTGSDCAYVGSQGAGVFEHNQTGGALAEVNVDYTLYVGKEAGSDGTYKMIKGDLNVDPGDVNVGEIRVGADNGLGRFYWKNSSAEGAKITTPTFRLGPRGTIAMGYDFDVADLASGALFETSTTVEGLDQGTLEVTDGATASQTGGTQTYGGLRVGSDDGGGTYDQSGGTTVSSGYVEINDNGKYEFTDGEPTLHVTGGGLHVAGTMDFQGNSVTVNVGAGSLVNFVNATFNGAGSTNVTIGTSGGADTLTILPTSWSSPFGTYVQHGDEHTAGSTLTIDGSKSYNFAGVIADTVDVQGGTLVATTDKYIHLGRFRELSGGGTVDLGLGELTADTSATMSGGSSSLSARTEYVGKGWDATFTQTDGTNTVSEALYLGYGPGDRKGTYTLQGGGSLEAGYVVVGYDSSSQTSVFNHHDGDVDAVNELYVGYEGGSQGQYICWSVTSNLMGGFAVKCATIGYEGEGTFTHKHGNVQITGDLVLGEKPGSSGTYNIEAGIEPAETNTKLVTDGLIIGAEGSGAFSIGDADIQITINDRLSFGPDSTFSAVPDSTIHMAGADLEIQNTDPMKLTGLGNLTLIFEGGAAEVAELEVAGQPGGGFVSNFALGALTIGGAEDGIVDLVDFCENAGGDQEALFVHNLSISGASTLDLNGLGLYVEGDVENTLDGWIGGVNTGRLCDSTLMSGWYLDAVYDLDQDWTTLTPVPEPATVALFTFGGLAILRWRKRK